MTWTDEDKNYLLNFKNAVDSDDIKIKETIKKLLLSNKYIIHTVGPVVSTYVSKQKEKELASCYKKSLQLAVENGARTIAFPCISTGVFNFPKDLASAIALYTVDRFISKNRDKIDKVVFILWKDVDVEIYKKVVSRVDEEQYIKITSCVRNVVKVDLGGFRFWKMHMIIFIQPQI